jgi:tartrate dehydratase alpha subunit/fumarate hydratase class I-like protein
MRKCSASITSAPDLVTYTWVEQRLKTLTVESGTSVEQRAVAHVRTARKCQSVHISCLAAGGGCSVKSNASQFCLLLYVGVKCSVLRWGRNVG